MTAQPDAGLTDYERRREDNIRRNDAILASLQPRGCRALRLLPRPVAEAVQEATAAALDEHSRPPLLRTRGLPHSDASSAVASSSPATPPSPSKPRTRTTRFSSSLAASLRASAAAAAAGDASAPAVEDGFGAGRGLVLRPTDVRRVLPKRILSLRILPLADRTVVATGDMIGHIGLWDVDGVVEDEEDGDGADGVFEYSPHMGPVPVIVAHPAEPGKIYSCSYDGEICLTDVEKETFDIVQRCDYPIISLCQAPNNVSCLYFGEGNGELKLFDERMSKVTTTWNVHYSRINSIDCHPENTNMFATSSTDQTACLWDLRHMKNKDPESLKVFEHSNTVQLAYFSPSGGMVATTRAVWGWNSIDLFIGNVKRAIDVISIDCGECSLSASYRACLESEYMTTIPCRFSLHPYKIGRLACASSGGKVFLWTRA